MHWIPHAFSFWLFTQKISLEMSVPRWGALHCCPGQPEQLCARMRLPSRMENRLWNCIMNCLDFNSQVELWILNDSYKLWLDVTQHLWKSGHHPFFTLSHALQGKSIRLFFQISVLFTKLTQHCAVTWIIESHMQTINFRHLFRFCRV